MLTEIAQAEELAADPDMRELAQDELTRLGAQRDELEQRLKVLLTPRDPNDEKNIIVEIRAGTGRRGSGALCRAICSACTRATPSVRAGASS